MCIRDSYVESVAVEAVLANDYRVDVATLDLDNAQGRSYANQYLTSFYRTMLRASGNVQDGSNQGFVEVKYGLPVANEIFGLTLDISDVGGFYFSGEYDRSRQHFRYPRPGRDYPGNSIAELVLKNGTRRHYVIPRPGERFD